MARAASFYRSLHVSPSLRLSISHTFFIFCARYSVFGFNDEPSKKHYKINVCTMRHRVSVYIVCTFAVCFRAIFNVWHLYFCHFELPRTLWNFVLVCIFQVMLCAPFYRPQNSYPSKTVTDVYLVRSTCSHKFSFANCMECVIIFTECEYSYFLYFRILFILSPVERA